MIDLIGQRFSLLTVAGIEQGKYRRLWKCQCDCGGVKLVSTNHLRTKSVTNCGCRFMENRKALTLRHGDNRLGKRSKEYRAWAHILGRCTNPTDAAYASYGGRGIKIADGWRRFEGFLSDMGRAPTPQHSVDRIDNDGNYEPGNCRRATQSQQVRNTRRTIRVGGKCLKDICEERSLNYQAVQRRLRRGDPEELALSPLIGRAYRAMIAAAPPPSSTAVEGK